MHFEARAESYASARPPYPDALWRRLAELGLLRPGLSALDLGAGTGQATGPMLAAGLQVTAVEPGARLAEILHATYPAARVIVSRAEDLDLAEADFDLVVAATSIHWIDLDVTLPKITSILKPDGRLVVWRNVFGDAAAEVTPFRQRVHEIVSARTTPRRSGPAAEDVDETITALTASGLFFVTDASTFRWSLSLDAAGIGRLFDTFSDWSPDEVQRAVDAVEALGGSVVEYYSSWLLVLAPTAGNRPER